MTFVNDHRIISSYQREILYIDENNLYGAALSMPLPQSKFVWVEDQAELHKMLECLPSVDWANSDMGFVMEVDMEIPQNLHDQLDDFPLAPESRKVSHLTPFMAELWSLAEGRLGYHSTQKLILSHLPKKNYVVHFATLQFYLKMGVRITQIHRAVQFQQSAYLEPYITDNSLKRQHATSDFDKDYYKLMNNAVFGKSCENVRNRIDFRLCTTPNSLKSYTSKPLFKQCHIFTKDCVGVEMVRTEVCVVCIYIQYVHIFII